MADARRERAERRAAAARGRRTGEERFSAAQVDASDADAVAALAREVRATHVFNAVDPRFVMPIFSGALAADADYLDMAMSLSVRHPDQPYEQVGVKLGDEQFARAGEWEAAGRLALLGIGVEPGLSDVFARYAADELFDHIAELGTRDGANLVIRDDDGNEVIGRGPDHTGELFVKSPSVFADYYKQHDKFLADNKHGYQTVGDIAYIDDENYVYICDRKKDMIISGGMNIYPAEIEAALEAHPDIYEAAVLGIPSEEWGELVHAVVVKRPGSDLDEAGVTAHSREHLAGYKLPRSISWLDELGYDAHDVGPLAEGWRFQRDTAAYVTPYADTERGMASRQGTVQELQTLLAAAKRYRDMG